MGGLNNPIAHHTDSLPFKVMHLCPFCNRRTINLLDDDDDDDDDEG